MNEWPPYQQHHQSAARLRKNQIETDFFLSFTQRKRRRNGKSQKPRFSNDQTILEQFNSFLWLLCGFFLIKKKYTEIELNCGVRKNSGVRSRNGVRTCAHPCLSMWVRMINSLLFTFLWQWYWQAANRHTRHVYVQPRVQWTHFEPVL